ncbi:histidine kinase [Candidatus Magnetomoraceae bacterium gMMP-15]
MSQTYCNNRIKGNILVVEDNPKSLRLLDNMLTENGYTVRPASTGSLALKSALSTPPDLILLDIMLPDIYGYEICKRLKADKKTRDIPIIFLSAKSEIEDKTKGFQLGAVDYITKPFNLTIVEARVHTHIELKRHRDHLKELAEEKARQLIHSERLATLGTISAGIAHEICDPLSGILASIQTLQLALNKIPHYLKNSSKEKTEEEQKCALYLKRSRQFLPPLLNSARRITSIINSMQRLSREDDKKTMNDIQDSIEEALNLCRNELKYNVNIEKKINHNLPQFLGNARQVEQVLINILKNAADAMKGSEKGKLIISVLHDFSSLFISIEDTGPGISENDLENIWKPFFTTKDLDKNTGLGLSISKGIIEDHKGKIWAENRDEGGAKFVIRLPVSC